MEKAPNPIRIDCKRLNAEVGRVLRAARKRAGLSTTDACKAFSDFTAEDLLHVETGLRSLPGYILYELSVKYEMTFEEMRLFCFPEETKKRFRVS